jgi:ankyrin repeat protein
MLYTICAYGGSPDRQDQKGNTPLHKAAQYGPLRAVMTLMGFRANHKLRNNAGTYSILIK